MNITVLGLGHLGTVVAAGLAMAGHRVTGVDIDRQRIEALRYGKSPLHEPGLGAWLMGELHSGNLRFLHRDDTEGHLGDIVLIATGTPPTDGGAADLDQVWDALAWLKFFDLQDVVLVMKSTVPPGTGEAVLKDIQGTGARYVANPEFLREGQALQDWRSPERIVVGVEAGDGRSVEAIERMYSSIEAPYIVTDIASAEMIKYASNAFLATRISFINEIASVCDRVGASVDVVSAGLAMDTRTGSRMRAGIGYGGSCFPKDVRALDHLAVACGLDLKLLRAVVQINNRQRMLPLRVLRRRFGDDMAGLAVGVLGLTFKPDTDDVREAASLSLIQALVDEGASVRAFDPQANEAARRLLPPAVKFVETPSEACSGAHAVVLLTEWPEIVAADWWIIAAHMRSPKLLFDGRNALDTDAMSRLGFEYTSVGRGRSVPPHTTRDEPLGKANEQAFGRAVAELT